MTSKPTRILFPIVILFISLHSCRKQPTAKFSVDTSSPYSNEVITFTNLSEEGLFYEWDFGDGYTSTVENPTHIYTNVGTYNVTLTAFSKKKKKMDTYSYTLVITAGIRAKMIALWNYESAQTKRYENGVLTLDDEVHFDDFYSVHTVEFKEDDTYITNLDGSIDGEGYTVIESDAVFIIAGTTYKILEINANEFTFVSTTTEMSGSDVTIDSIFAYLDKSF